MIEEYSTIKDRVDRISNNKDITMNTQYTTCKIEVCGVCNMKCKFCYEKELARSKTRQKKMNIEDLKLVLDILKEKVPTIKEVGLFYMGEPGLNNYLDRMYKLCKEYGYFTYLTTNGLYIHNILRSIPYVDSLKVSWNYKDPSDFQNKTGLHKDEYYRIADNTKYLYDICHKYNKDLTISTIVKDEQDKEEYLSSLKELYYDYHYFLPLQTQGGYNVSGTDGVVGEYDKQSSTIPCWSLFKGVYIDSDFNIRTCCYGHTEEFIIGNIKTNPNFNKDVFKEDQLNHKIPNICRNCLRTTSAKSKSKGE